MNYFRLFIFNILAMTACTRLVITEPPQAVLPDRYSVKPDSNAQALENIRNFFRDSLLIELIETGIRQNADLKIAQQNLLISRQHLIMQKGTMLPAVNAGTSFAQRKYGLYTMDGAGNITTEITPGQITPIHLQDYWGGLQASWEIGFWGKLKNQKKSAQLRLLATEEGKSWLTTWVVSEIASSYFTLLGLDSEIDIVSQTLELQKNELMIVKLLKENGNANQLAVSQFESQILESECLLNEIRQQITSEEFYLNTLLGRYYEPIKRNPEFFRMATFSTVSPGIPSDLLQKRPDIRQAEHILSASHLDVKAARAAFYPSVMLTGSFGWQAFHPKYFLQTPQSIAYGAIGGIAAPLINRKALKARLGEASAQQEIALCEYQQHVFQAFNEVSMAMNKADNLRLLHAQRIRQTQLQKESVRIATELFKTGKANYLEVLTAQKNALESQLALNEVMRNQLECRIFLYKSLGGGW